MKTFRFALASAALAFPLSASTSICADPGVEASKIKLGQTCALKGPASGLGLGMRAGLQACFTQVNKSGGVDGRKIELETLNDSYEPETCELTTKQLIEKDQVFLLIGGVGTPTAKVAKPICEAARVPFVAPFTGAELLRAPFSPYVVNVRASYYQETERLAQLLVDERKLSRIACFHQNDSFGLAGYDGIRLALERRSMQLVARGKFERNTTAIGPGLMDIAASTPDAIVMIGPYKPIAAFVKAAKVNEDTLSAHLCTVSFVGTLDLLKEVGDDGEGLIVSQVVPFPWDTTLSAVRDFQADMKAAGDEAQIGFTSLEGWLAGRFFCRVLDALEGPVTREKFIEQVDRTTSLDLGGFTLTFGPQDHQGSDSVWLTEFRGGRVVPMK